MDMGATLAWVRDVPECITSSGRSWKRSVRLGVRWPVLEWGVIINRSLEQGWVENSAEYHFYYLPIHQPCAPSFGKDISSAVGSKPKTLTLKSGTKSASLFESGSTFFGGWNYCQDVGIIKTVIVFQRKCLMEVEGGIFPFPLTPLMVYLWWY